MEVGNALLAGLVVESEGDRCSDRPFTTPEQPGINTFVFLERERAEES